KKKTRNKKSIRKIPSYFYAALTYGARYYSHTQTGVLGNANVGALFLNQFSFVTGFKKRNYTFTSETEVYQFKYAAENGSDSKQIFTQKIIGTYNGFAVSIGI